MDSQEVDRAFAALRSHLPGYSYPPQPRDLAAIERLAGRSWWGAGWAAAMFVALTVFGAFYLVRPGDAFRLAARLFLDAAPFAWLGSGVFVAHCLRERKMALMLAAWMARHRAK